ncbi:hypothetical protein ABG067_001687 [Albugo candida]
MVSRSVRLVLIALTTQFPSFHSNVPDHISLDTFAHALPFEVEKVSRFLQKLQNYIDMIVHKQIDIGIHLRRLNHLRSQYFILDCESEITQLRETVFLNNLPRLEIACGGLTSSLTQPWTTSKSKIAEEMRLNWQSLKVISEEVTRLSSNINRELNSELLNAGLDDQIKFFENKIEKMYPRPATAISQSTNEMVLSCWRLLNEATLKRRVFRTQYRLVKNAVLERNWLQTAAGHLLPKHLRDSFSTDIENIGLYGRQRDYKKNQLNYWHPREAMDSYPITEEQTNPEIHLTCEFATESQIIKPVPGMTVISTENFLAMCIMEAFNRESLLLFPKIISYIRNEASFNTLEKVEKLQESYASTTGEQSSMESYDASQVISHIHNLIAVWLGELRSASVELRLVQERYNELVNSLTATQMRISRAVHDLDKVYHQVIEDHSSTLEECHGNLHHSQLTGIFQKLTHITDDKRYSSIMAEKRHEVVCSERKVKQLKASMQETQLHAGDLFVNVINLEKHIIAFVQTFTHSKRVFRQDSGVTSMVSLIQEYLIRFEIPRIKAEAFEMHGRIALAQYHATKFSTCVMDTSLLTFLLVDDKQVQCVEHERSGSHDAGESIPMLAAFLL